MLIDVVEKVNMMVSKNGVDILNGICDEINSVTYLTGIYQLKIRLNDKKVFDQKDETQRNCQTSISRPVFEFEDIEFHLCVPMSQFEDNRSITFPSPDIEFN